MPFASPELLAQIRARLHEQLAPAQISLEDDSARHTGHREAAGRHHLKLRIVSTRFAGRDRLARHRLVHAALADELAGPVHALNIQALTPEEAENR
jgi:BolA protein